MSNNWSEKIEQRFCTKLPDDVRAWVDQQPWRHGGGAEFCVALSPEQLLEPEPGTIWPGFMLPDTLPLVGNGYGDWLCLRFNSHGTVGEVIRWSHGGGDWIPYGGHLAEALIYDFAAHCAPFRPPVFERPVRSPELSSQLGHWADQWMMLDLQDVLDASAAANGLAVLDLLLRNRVAEFAVRRDRTLKWLDSGLKSNSEPRLAAQLDIAWEPDFVRWLFDTDLIPSDRREQLARHFEQPPDDLFKQAWERAEREALAVIEKRCDLGWAFDIAGWAAERRGDLGRASRLYFAGLHSSLFSDETVAFRTHWIDERYGKFAAARLAELESHLSAQQACDPYLNLFWEIDAASTRTRVREHWLHKARDAKDPAAAYDCYYRAGWDLGSSDHGAYAEILTGLVTSAAKAGARTLAAVAEMHLRFLD